MALTSRRYTKITTNISLWTKGETMGGTKGGCTYTHHHHTNHLHYQCTGNYDGAQSYHKQGLKSTPRTHSHHTKNDIPGSVLPIVPTQNWCPVPTMPTPVTPATPLHWSAHFGPKASPIAPTQIQQVRFVPIKGGVCQRNIISQEAINFLTEAYGRTHKIYSHQIKSSHNLPHHVWILHRLLCQWYTLRRTKPSAATNNSCTIRPPPRSGRPRLEKILEGWHKERKRLDKKVPTLFLWWHTQKSPISQRTELSLTLELSLIFIPSKLICNS